MDDLDAVTPEGEVRVDADLLAYVASKHATASIKDKGALPIDSGK